MVDPSWRRARACGASNTCVEVADLADEGAVLVRDSADPAGPRLALSREAFAGLLAVIREASGDLTAHRTVHLREIR